MHLIVAESSARCRTLVAAARTQHPDDWLAVSLSGFNVEPKKGKDPVVDGKINTTIRDRRALNKVLQACTDAQDVYLCLTPDPRGEWVSHTLHKEITERYPELLVWRLPLGNLREFDLGARRPIDPQGVAQYDASLALNIQFAKYYSKAFAMPAGRAIIPALALLEAAGNDACELHAGGLRAHGQSPYRDVLAGAKGKPFPLETRTTTTTLMVPDPVGVVELGADGGKLLGSKALEAWSQAKDLIDLGLLAWGIPRERARKTVAEIVGERYLSEFPVRPGTYLVPATWELTPSEVPRPVREIYRLCWARGLASVCRDVETLRHEAHVFIEGVRFNFPWSYEFVEGWPRVAMGIGVEHRPIPSTITVDDIIPVHGVPEYSAVWHLQDFDNPAVVLRALENNGYIEYRGRRVVVTDLGRDLLTQVTGRYAHVGHISFLQEQEARLRAVGRGEIEGPELVQEYTRYLGEVTEPIPLWL